ncbi:DNA ligase [Vibrio sp. CAIM 722]|uniref:DNA ligase n=1 Tax=Vibrio eleionomae TaxID=2653505 RepID=A0A7X4RV40_9VIBR|nr:DNA ligase [Vibrio eleionomae]MZI93910.1 DNA ligase [Vibrio eleionomae]
MSYNVTIFATSVIILSPVLISAHALTLDVPKLTLAKEYQSGLALRDYWVSEKYDGIRALWTGSELVTRSGKVIHAPKWFTDSMPPDHRVEGELWAGRGQFNQVQKTVLDEHPDDQAWKNIRWMVFDLPAHAGDYTMRYAVLNHWVHSLNKPFVQVVGYRTFQDEQALRAYHHSVEHNGAEGVMLRRIRDSYQIGRSESLLKLKSYQDAEAVVIGYKKGNGRLRGKVGALRVRNEAGHLFYIGSGLTDAERESPPAVGATITYRYNGETSTGKPRFARFMRERRDIE